MASTQTACDATGSAHQRKRLLDITVLAGGPGAERAVSLESGRAVAAALQRLGHRVTVSDIDPNHLTALERDADFVFIALHGEFGEDGQVQALLEARGIPYSGSGVEASRLAMNKALAKQRFEQAGIPTPPYAVVKHERDIDTALKRTGVPAVVKPVSSGSSVDTTINRTESALRDAAAAVLSRYGEALVEQYVSGPELTVGILGDRALPVCEIRTRRDFYDYAAKYEDDDTEYVFDIDLPGALLREVQDIALTTHRVLGCRAFSRVDVMVDRCTRKPYVLEVNTIPGFTSHSLVPKAAARVGIGFEALCQRIIDLSLAVYEADATKSDRNATPT